jgi:hypothetical protein
LNNWLEVCKQDCTNIYTLNADDFTRGLGFHVEVRKNSKGLVQWLNADGYHEDLAFSFQGANM